MKMLAYGRANLVPIAELDIGLLSLQSNSKRLDLNYFVLTT